MLQQVNLYQEAFKKKKIRLSASVTLAAVLTLLALVIIYSAFQAWELKKIKNQYRQFEAKHTELLKQKEGLAAITSKEPNAELLQRIEQKESELTEKNDRKQQIASYLLQARGYSNYLIALARNHMKNFWLTDISVSNGGAEISIKGKTLDGPSLPAYIRRLEDDSIFHGVHLNVFKLHREADEEGNKHNYLDFVIGNLPVEKET